MTEKGRAGISVRVRPVLSAGMIGFGACPMTKKQHIIFTYLLMNTIMCACMALAALLVNVGSITLSLYLRTLLESLLICNLSTVVFRIPALADKTAATLSGHKRDSKAFGIWNGVANATLNTLFMNTLMTLLNVGFHAAFFKAWLHSFPALELVSVLVSLAAAPYAMKIAVSAGK